MMFGFSLEARLKGSRVQSSGVPSGPLNTTTVLTATVFRQNCSILLLNVWTIEDILKQDMLECRHPRVYHMGQIDVISVGLGD